MENNEALEKLKELNKREMIAEAAGIAVGCISGLAAEVVMTEVIFDQFKDDFQDMSLVKKAGMCLGTLAISSTVAGLVWNYVENNTKETVTMIQEKIFKDDVVAEVIADMEKEETDGRLSEEENGE